MLAKKVLSAFFNEGSLDFDLFEKLLESSSELKSDLTDLSLDELDLLVKILIDARRPQTISKLLDFLESEKIPYRSEIFVLGLVKTGYFLKTSDFSNKLKILSGLEKETAFILHPFIEVFPDQAQRIIEASLAFKREQVEAFREDLKDQIEFLKSEQLTEKAIEIERKLKFHFPEIKQNFLSKEQAEIKSKEHSFSKLIERNIPFDSRSKNRANEASSNYLKTLKDEQDASLELAEAWYSDLKDKDLDLLLTQLEFIDFKQPDFYLKILKEQNLDVWTKLFLYMKSETYLEGLQFLDENENDILTTSSENIYNYYYTKGVFLLGAGMNKEAEEIFTIIKDQKENFRDIQLLLKKS